MKRKYGIFCLLVLFLVLGIGTPSLTVQAKVKSGTRAETGRAGKFVKSKKKWRYRYKDGTYAKDSLLRIKGKIYYFSPKGYRMYGWQKIGKFMYYFGKNSEGFMYQNRWVSQNGKRTCYLKKNGHLSMPLSADCAILVDAATGEVIYSKNPDMRHGNGSTTKIMTCILALEKCKMWEKVTASANAAAQVPTKLYLNAGETFRMKDMLYSLMVPSHNDTAVAIAEHIGGSEKAFVKMMNRKAAKLGCTNTHFATASGLDMGLEHYTTARDLAKIAAYAWKSKTFRKIAGTTSYSMKSIQGKRYRFETSNELLNVLPGVKGMKTGYTRKAGNCFVGVVQAKSGKTYISVVLGSPTEDSRWDDSRALLTFAYNL